MQPQRSKNDVAPIPLVKCSFCSQMTVLGLHQIQFTPAKKGRWVEENGEQVWKPPTMNRKDIYMCDHCKSKGVKWPKRKDSKKK